MLKSLRRHPVLASALVYAAATALMGREVLASIGTSIAGDLGDPLLNTAILAWNARTLPWTEQWYQFPSFYPARDILTFSEYLLGVSVITSPIYWATDNGVAAYNLTYLLTYVLSGLSMFALVRWLTRSDAAAFLAGLAFAFAPYRVSHVAHLQIAAIFWAPLALLGLHAFLDTGRRRWLVVFGLCWTLQCASNAYYLVFFSVLVALWVLWFVVARARWRELGLIAAAGALALIPNALVLARFVSAHAHYGLSRPPEETTSYGADLAAVLCASPLLDAWGWLRVACRPEGELFPGVALIVLGLVGGVWVVAHRAARDSRGASVAGFYLVAAVVTWMLAWGPAPALQGEPALPYGPYALLMLLPGGDGLRVPARFWMMTVLCLAVLMGIFTSVLLSRLRPRASALVVLVAAAVALADGWATLPTAQLPPPVPNPAALRGGVTLTLPLGAHRDTDIVAQVRAVEGGWRSVNGFSGYEPYHYGRLRRASADADPLVFAPFTARGDLDVVVARDAGALLDLVERQPGSELVAQNDAWRQYTLPQQGRLAAVEPEGRRLPVADLTATCSPEMLPFVVDDDHTTRWHCGPQTPGQQITAELEGPALVGTVVPAVGPSPSDDPRHLVVETSLDGSQWEQVWNGDVRLEMLVAEMHAPLARRLVVEFEPRRARYVRLRQVARDEVFYWSVAELEVWTGGDGDR